MIDLQKYYQEKAEAFVKTVVCFDDKAEYCKPILSNLSEIKIVHTGDGFDSPLVKPDEATIKLGNDDGNGGEQLADSEELDARALTEGFAKRNILCSVLIPHASIEAIKAQIAALASVADITILDWKLAPNNSTIARDAIVEMLKSDIKIGGRLRLITIYSDADAKNVINELHKLLKDDGFELVANKYELRGRNASVVFFQKPRSLAPLGEVVEYADLPARTIQEFAKLTSGLLPVTALSAITEIREQTHHLLATFPSILDGAFLAHRSLIPDPNDAEEFILDIFEGEIGSLLKHNKIGESVNAECCSAWIESKNLCDPAKQKILVKTLSDYNLKKKQEFRKFFDDDKLDERIISEKVVELMYKDKPEQLTNAKARLTMLSSLDIHSKSIIKVAPRLKLGSIIKEVVDDSARYLMCIQPLCDSVRIKHTTGKLFPFITLQRTDIALGDGILDLCIHDGSEIIWLTAKPTPSSLESHNFLGKSNKEQFVEARLLDANYCFASDKKTFIWLGDLRIGKAQRIASQLAARIHTLGIDEFEWLRLHQRQGDGTS